MHLTGRVAIVTGGGNGIGEAMVRRFAREGAKVVIADINLNAAEKVAEDLRKEGFEALACRVDVTSKQDVEAMVNKAENEFGKVDILANIAGILGPSSGV